MTAECAIDQRFYASSYGMFNTPDAAPSAHLGDPASWSRYSYVEGDPVNLFDPRGLTTCDPNRNNCYDSVTVTASASGLLDLQPVVTFAPSLAAATNSWAPGVQAAMAALQRPLSVSTLYNLATDLAGRVNGTTCTNCKALANYAGAAAWQNR